MSGIQYYLNEQLSIDYEANAAYVTVAPCESQLFTVEHNNIVYIDYDDRGNLHGIELLDLKSLYPVDELAEKNSDLWELLTKVNKAILKNV